jgi:hypothetical protein
MGLAVVLVLGLGQVGIWEMHRVQFRNRLRQAVPRVRAESTRQLQMLTRAIENYKSTLGMYPPDHLLDSNPTVVDSITNQLLYELLGTVYDQTNDAFTPIGFPRISAKLAKQFFNVTTFKNTSVHQELVKQFIRSSDILATMGVSQKPDVGVLAFSPNWEGIDPELLQEFPLVPWQYNCTAPVHNRGSYDLWVEFSILGSKIVIANW